MRHPIRSLALALTALATCLSGGVSAQQPAAPVATAAALPPAPEVAKPALWKVSDPDTTIYLFGTVHALPAGIKWLDGPVATALQSSQTLVTEIPDTDVASMQAAIMQMAVLPPNQNLRNLLSPDDQAKFEAALKDAGLPIEAFDRFEPWYAAVALSSLPLIKSGYSSENGVEAQLSAKAKALGQPHEGLETAASQLSLFDKLPMDVQRHYLHEVVAGLPTLTQELNDIVKSWSIGDAEKLAKLMNADEDDPQMTTILLTNRNKAWAEWIKQRLAKPGTVFIAVGAGHLAGPESVQKQLAAQGFTATRVQ
jgi:uncharacterized protein YbaP (TraB family)